MGDTTIADDGPTKHQALVGSHHSIGPDGPTYEVVRIIDNEKALICILEAEREVEYEIADILQDPGPDAAWKNR